MSIEAKPKTECEKCNREKPDVKFDPGTRLYLCNACWFLTPPRFG